MKSILKICFERGGSINRKEYFFANIFILVICILLFFVFSRVFIYFPGEMNIFISALMMAAPMLVFFTYTGLNITWKRGRDFLKSNVLIYIFSVVIVVMTWSPILFVAFPGYAFYLMLHPVVIGLGFALNLLWFIFWLIFQFHKGKTTANEANKSTSSHGDLKSEEL